MGTRHPAVAGMFYPGSAQAIKEMIASFPVEQERSENAGSIHGIIVPHAGYIYSGPTAKQAFARVADTSFDRIIILGPSHNFGYRGVVRDNQDAWESPLGARQLDYTGLDFVPSAEVHAPEHSLEVQLPFLQVLNIDGPIAPLLVGEVSDSEAQSIAKQLLACVEKNKKENKKILIVLSTDLSHYLSREEGGKKDETSIEIIKKLELAHWSDIDACGRYPLRILMHVCKQNGWQPRLVHHSDSGDASGDTQKVVGYASFVF